MMDSTLTKTSSSKIKRVKYEARPFSRDEIKARIIEHDMIGNDPTESVLK